MKKYYLLKNLLLLLLSVVAITTLAIIRINSETLMLLSASNITSDTQQATAIQLAATAGSIEQAKRKTAISAPQIEAPGVAISPVKSTSEEFYAKLIELETYAQQDNVKAIFDNGASLLARDIGRLLNVPQDATSIASACKNNSVCSLALATKFTPNFTISESGKMMSGEKTYALTYSLAEINPSASAILGNVSVTIQMVKYLEGGININYIDIGDFRI